MGVNRFADEYYKYINKLSSLHFIPFTNRKAKMKRINYFDSKTHNIKMCHDQVRKFSKKDLLLKKRQLYDMLIIEKMTKNKISATMVNTLELCEGCIQLYEVLQVH